MVGSRVLSDVCIPSVRYNALCPTPWEREIYFLVFFVVKSICALLKRFCLKRGKRDGDGGWRMVSASDEFVRVRFTCDTKRAGEVQTFVSGVLGVFRDGSER